MEEKQVHLFGAMFGKLTERLSTLVENYPVIKMVKNLKKALALLQKSYYTEISGNIINTTNKKSTLKKFENGQLGAFGAH